MTVESSLRTLRGNLPRVLQWAMWPFLGMAAYSIYLNASTDAYIEANAFLTAKIAELDRKIEERQDLERRREALLARVSVVRELKSRQGDALNLLNVLSMADEAISISSIRFSNQRLKLTGYTSDATKLPEFIRLLESYQFTFDGENDVYEVSQQTFRIAGQWRTYDDVD